MKLFDHPLKVGNIEYNTVENYYQAQKMPLDRLDLREKISNMSPFEAKRVVKTAEYLPWREDWSEDLSLRVMEYALNWKFSPGTSWWMLLMKTGDEEIVEWNNWGDVFFGKRLDNNRGKNHLGKILMKIRAANRLDKKLEQ